MRCTQHITNPTHVRPLAASNCVSAPAPRGPGGVDRPRLGLSLLQRRRRITTRRARVCAGPVALLSPQVSFLAATVAVVPLYTLMIAAPRATLTKRVMASPLPTLALAVLYTVLFVASWEPDTFRLIMNPDFYFLPQLDGIAVLFSRATALASAWVHLLCVDFYAATQVYHDSMKNDVPATHSLVLCMMCCPVGLLSHAATKAWVLRGGGAADEQAAGVGTGVAA